jgi:hypothetical protein
MDLLLLRSLLALILLLMGVVFVFGAIGIELLRGSPRAPLRRAQVAVEAMSDSERERFQRWLEGCWPSPSSGPDDRSEALTTCPSRFGSSKATPGEVNTAGPTEVFWKGELVGFFEPDFSDFPRTLGTWTAAETPAAERFLEALRLGETGAFLTVRLGSKSPGIWCFVNSLRRAKHDLTGGKVLERWEMVLSPAPPERKR